MTREGVKTKASPVFERHFFLDLILYYLGVKHRHLLLLFRENQKSMFFSAQIWFRNGDQSRLMVITCEQVHLVSVS